MTDLKCPKCNGSLIKLNPDEEVYQCTDCNEIYVIDPDSSGLALLTDNTDDYNIVPKSLDKLTQPDYDNN